MLIPFSFIFKFLYDNGINIKGILHIGAHECEEKEAYNNEKITDENIYWIDGNEDKIKEMKGKGNQNIYFGLIDDEEHEVEFNITNNGQSSSILPLQTHSQLYPHIVVTEKRKMKTITIKKLLEQENIDYSKLNFWNLDIQGAELRALKGASSILKHVDAIYTEVNTDYLYKDCVLLPELDSYLSNFGLYRVFIQMYKNDGWGDALYIKRRV